MEAADCDGAAPARRAEGPAADANGSPHPGASANPIPHFLVGGGETGALIRAHDWAATPLGAPHTWPLSLRTAVALLLQARQPMYVAWGPQLNSIYNDGYIPICGAKHPAAIGQPYSEMWREIWASFRPIVESTLAGQAHLFEDRPIGLAGRTEPVGWFSFSYTPLRDDAGRVAGIFCAALETTTAVRARDRLATEHERLAQLFDQAPSFMAMLRGPEHRFEFANPAYRRLVGRRDIAGKTVVDALPEAEGQGYLRLLDEVYASGQPYTARGATYRVPRGNDGVTEERILDFVFQPVRDAAGTVSGVFVEGVDVTDRAIAEAARRLSESRLQELNAQLEQRIVDSARERGRTWQVSPDLLGVVNAEGHFERSNPAWLKTLGWTECEIARTPLFEMIHPGDLERTRAAFDELARGQPVLRFENRYRCRDGRYRWLSWVAVPEAGKFYCSARDTTDDKQRALELTQRTAERDRVWRNSRDLLVVIGADGVFRDVNPAWTAILGHAIDEVVGRRFDAFVWPDDAGLTLGGLAAAASSADLSHFENRYRHRDGTPRWISWHTAVEDELVYAYGRDVTQQKEAEAQLGAVQEALRQSQKMEAIGQLTGGVAHDFNNLLQVVSANLDLISRQADDQDRVKPRVAAAQAAVRRGAKLASQLLAFGRRQALEPRVINVGRFLAGIEDMLRHTLGGAVEIELIVSGGLWRTVVDPSQMENAVLNLAINARDAMGGTGRLTIEVGNAYLDGAYARRNAELAPGQYVMLAVTDTGSGMAPETARQAFDPFFSTKPTGSGTGLGLSMVYGFVKQSGGHVKLDSELGHGTTMRLYLPRALQAEEAADATAAPAGPAPSGAETVLVVEDDEGVRTGAVALLEELGYRVLKAGDAASARALIDAGAEVDLLFTDVVMPGTLSSSELAEHARARLPAVAVLFTSGYAQNAVVHGGRLDRGVELLPKPYTREALAHRIRTVLAARAAIRPERGHAAPPTRPAAAPAPAAARLIVLLVEDDEAVRLGTAELLHDLGHAVVEAASAEEAMAFIRRVPVDVLLTDLGLPGMSGEVFAAEARGLRPALRVVFATGRPLPPSAGAERGGPVLLRKPYDSVAIAHALRTSLGRDDGSALG